MLRLRRAVLNPYSHRRRSWRRAGSAAAATTSRSAPTARSACSATSTSRLKWARHIGRRPTRSTPTSRAAACSTPGGSGARSRGLAYTLEAHARRAATTGRSWASCRARDFTHRQRRRRTGSSSPTSTRVFRRVYPGRARVLDVPQRATACWRSGQYAAWVQWDTKAGGGGWIEPKVFREDVREPFTIGRRRPSPPARYNFADLQLVLSMPLGRAAAHRRRLPRRHLLRRHARAGRSSRPTWNLSRHLELGARLSAHAAALRASAAQQDDIQLARLPVRAALDARASANAFVQYNSTTDRLDLNLRLRYNFAEGTDLWLVYNEGCSRPNAPDEPGDACAAAVRVAGA